MRRFATLGLFSLLATADLAATSVHIQEVGLNGNYTSNTVPTRIRVTVTNSEPVAETIELRFRIHDQKRGFERGGNRYTTRIMLGAGEERAVELPMLMVDAYEPVAEVEARDASGRIVAHDAISVSRGRAGILVAILCAEKPVCEEVEAAIAASRPPAQEGENRAEPQFAFLLGPEEHWWAYCQAGAVVLAAPTQKYSQSQRTALEDYARMGGHVLLVMDRVADPTIFAGYGEATASGKEQGVAKGSLTRTPTIRVPEFKAAAARLVAFGAATTWQTNWRQGANQGSEMSWMSEHFTTVFHFPGLGWLLSLLGLYVLTVGIVNFSILHRIGQREWGWVTVPALALIFSVAIFAASTARRPKQVGEDEIAVYWMDDHSSVAAAEGRIRVSSPHGMKMQVRVPGEWIFTWGTELWREGGPGLMLAAGAEERGWDIEFGPPWQTELPFMQWSFRDLEFQTIKRFPGTVVRSSATRLRNETGQEFQQAIYLDKENAYFLGFLAKNAEVDFSAAQKSSVKSLSRPSFPFPRKAASEFEGIGNSKELGSLLMTASWLPYVERNSETCSGVFFGLAEENVLGAAVSAAPVTRQSHALTIVSFTPRP